MCEGVSAVLQGEERVGIKGVGGWAAFRKRRRTYLTLQPCQREQNTEESRG